MRADKEKIKPILDGLSGEEVAINMKGNFDYLVDAINNNSDILIIKETKEVTI